jgi:hypothetical protein
MKHILLVATCLLSIGGFAYAAPLEQDPRVIQLNGCTGFMVDGNYLVTAKHCTKYSVVIDNQGRKLYGPLGDIITFKSGSETLTAKMIFVTSNEDGPAIYYVAKGSHPSFKVAASVPPAGTKVYTIGFPGGDYAVLNGTILGGNKSRTVNTVSLRVNQGHSGGPLLNLNDEVIGITESVNGNLSDNRSQFTGWGQVVAGMAAAKREMGDTRSIIKSNKELVIFTADWCGNCQVLDSELDIEGLRKQGIKVTKVKHSDGWSNKSLAEEFYKKNGTKVDSLPTIWIRGSTKYKVGYAKGTKLSLFGWIVQGFKSIGTLLFGNNIEGEIIEPPRLEENPPSPDFDSIPVPEAEAVPEPIVKKIEWEKISIAIVVGKTTNAYIKGKAFEIGLKAMRGPLARANEEHLDGKANLLIIDERTQPLRFKAFIEAAGIVPDPIYVMVLAQRQDLGLKGLIAGKIEKTIEGKLPPGVPVEIVFERVHRQHYEDMTAALEVSDGLEEISPESNMKDDIISAMKAELVGVKGDIKGLVIPSKDEIVDGVKGNVIPAISEFRKAENDSGDERTLMQRIMAGLLVLIGGGQATGGIMNILKRRAMKKLGAVIGKSDEEPVKPVIESS